MCLVHERDSANRCGRLSSKSTEGIADRLCERLHHLAAVPTVVVLDGDTRLTVHFDDIERDLELRYVELHVLRGDGLPLHFVFGEHTELVSVHDLRREVIVGSDLRKRVVLVCERLFEMFARLADESLDGLVGYLSAQCQRVHHHTDRVRHLEVTAPVGDGGDTELIGVRKACEGIEDCSQGRTCRCHTCFLCKRLSGLKIHWGIDLPYLAVLGVGQVSSYLGHTFHLC